MMNFDNRDIDEEKLLDEIDRLDDTSNLDSRSNSKKSKNKTLKINKNVSIVILLIVVLIAYVLCEKYFKNSYSYQNKNLTVEDYDRQISNNKENFESLKKYLKIENFIEENGDIIVLLDNNTNIEMDDFYVNIVFFDGENNIIDIKNNYIDYIGKEQKRYISFNYNLISNYERIETVITKNDFYDMDRTNVTEFVDYSVVEFGDKLIINVDNNAPNGIKDILFEVVYFNSDGKVLDCFWATNYGITKKNSKIEFYTPYGIEENAKYEVNLIYAFE